MYVAILVILVLMCIALVYKTWQAPPVTTTPVFKTFQYGYLTVYLLMTMSDWLQGPYVYALYESYGFDMGDIAVLFIAGFGSSAVFGTFVGSLGDKYGRRRMCIIFGFTYMAACLTKLSTSFFVLLLGRLLGGIATSLLFSAFESWMVHEHKQKYGYPEDWLSHTFSLATIGNGFIAIVAGVLAGFVANQWGNVAPFMVAFVFLGIGTVIVYMKWTENFGDAGSEVKDTFYKAFNAMMNDRRIVAVGTVQSLFEGAMYTFVFMWTPVLQSVEDGHMASYVLGVIFASYMVAIMVGSSIFSIAMKKYTIEQILFANLIVAGVALAVPSRFMIFMAFLVFEGCCGVYFPAQGTMRGKYVPGEYRSAVMNYFRIPLNLIVVLVLVKVSSLEFATVFLLCTIMLAAAAAAQTVLVKATEVQAHLLPVHHDEEAAEEIPMGDLSLTDPPSPDSTDKRDD